jgi:glycerate kinase
VKNPLYGPKGASFVFAKQKGASNEEIIMLDKGLQNFAAIASQLNCDVNFPGAGAAGGLGAGSKLFLNSHIQGGMDFLINYTQLEVRIKEADVVITGEGKLDDQTLSGKVVDGVATLARRHNKKLIIIAGSCELSKKEINQMGIAQLITLKDHNTSEVAAIEMAKDHLKNKATLIQL